MESLPGEQPHNCKQLLLQGGYPLRSFKVYPDATLTSGFIRKFNLSLVPKRTSQQQEWDAWVMTSVRVHGVKLTLTALETLGLSILPNLSKESRPPRGRKGITSHGRRMVRFSARHLSDRYAQKCLSFLTCTLPPMPSEAVMILLPEWSRLLHNFRRKLQYHLKRAGLPTSIVGVTEVQEKRFENEGSLPLHIHWIFVGRKPRKTWEYCCEHYRECWRECIQEIIGNDYGIEWEASTRVESIRKDASGYIGKYMSKGCKAVRAVNEQGWEWLLPSSWYTCTNDLRATYKKNLYVVSGAVATKLYSLCQKELKHLIGWSRDISIPSQDGTQIFVGWCARLKRGISPEAFIEHHAAVGICP